MSQNKSKSTQFRLNSQQKIDVLRKLDEGVKANRLAHDYKVTESAILQIKKRKNELIESIDSKRNRFLSLKQKLEIIEKIKDEGVKQCDLSKEYGVGASTITRWKQNKKQMQRAMKINQFNSLRRTVRESSHPKMESALYKWYVEQKSKGTSITGIMLRTKACELTKSLRENDIIFHGSSGWMERFVSHYLLHSSQNNYRVFI